MTEREQQREALSQIAARQFLAGMPQAWVRRHEEDVCQEARIAAWRADAAYDERKGRYAPFITCSVERKLINYLRTSQRKDQPCLPLEGLTDDGEPLECVIPGDLGRYDERVVERAQWERIWRALWVMPVPQRRAVRAIYGRGESRETAGRRLGLSGQHVGRLARTGIHELRTALERGVAARPAPRCAAEGCDRYRTTLGYCNRCYQRHKKQSTAKGALETASNRRQISRNRELSIRQRETLQLLRRAEWLTTTELLAAAGLEYRTLMYRLQRLEKWGYVKSLRQQHASGGMERVWRAVQC